MKRMLLSICAVLVISCADKVTENTMIVSGNVKGLKKGTLYLQYLQDSTLVVLDSLKVDGDGSFSFSTELESPEVFYLYLNKEDNNEINDRIAFFGEPGAITINTSWNTFDLNAKIEGSESQKKWEEYQKNMSRFNKRNFEIMQMASSPESSMDSLQIDSLQTLSDKNTLRGYLYALNFAINNKDSYVAPYIALQDVSDANIKYLDSINNSLSPGVAASKYGKRLDVYIKNLKGIK